MFGVWSRSLLDEGWVTECAQSAYGHAATKRTWLYAYGTALPSLEWSAPRGVAVVGAGINTGQSAGRPRIEGRAASATPEAFRDVRNRRSRFCRRFPA